MAVSGGDCVGGVEAQSGSCPDTEFREGWVPDMPDKLRFKQIATGQWRSGAGGLSFSVVGLTEDGLVYKHTMNGWVPLGTKVTQARGPVPVGAYESDRGGRNDKDEPF